MTTGGATSRPGARAAGRDIPVQTLAALTVPVLLVHLLVLRGAPPSFSAAPYAPAARAMVTRSITVPPAAPAEATARPAVPDAAPLPDPPSTPSPALSTPLARAAAAPPDTAPPPAPAVDTAAAPAVPSAPAPRPAADALPSSAGAPLRETGLVASTYRVPGSALYRYDITGQAKKQSYSASATLQWAHNGEQYNAQMEVGAFLLGSRTQRSAGRITADGLQPERFSDKGRSEQAAHFNRDKGQISFSANTPSAPLLAGAQDRLSMILQLASMLAGDPLKYPPATTITLQTVSAREADTWLFTVEETETLDLPGGTVRAIKLTRNPRREFDQKMELWLATDNGYIPVRLRLTDASGDFIDQRWRGTESQ